MNIGVILTGIIEEYFLDELIKVYENCKVYKIVSTWDYIDSNIINKLKQNGFIVVTSTFPNDIDKCSVNFQNFSFKMGIEKAKEIGVTHVLRMRSDLYCNDINKLIEIYEKIYNDGKMIFLLYFLNRNVYYEYLIDFAHFGDLYMSEKYACCIKDISDSRFAEKFRQEEGFGTSDYNIIKKHVIFSAEELLKNNIEIRYLKKIHIHLGNVIKLWYEDNIQVMSERV